MTKKATMTGAHQGREPYLTRSGAFGGGVKTCFLRPRDSGTIDPFETVRFVARGRMGPRAGHQRRPTRRSLPSVLPTAGLRRCSDYAEPAGGAPDDVADSAPGGSSAYRGAVNRDEQTRARRRGDA